jgi:UDP-N-acetylmuramyl pentapeptide synthase
LIRLDDLLVATGGMVHGKVFADTFSDFCYDTRLLSRPAEPPPQPRELFLAVVTDKGDGHDYVLDAARQGAAGVLCQRPFDLQPYGVTCVIVEDSRQALLDWARFILHKLHPRVVAITGSSGKTTTKELTAAASYRSGSARAGAPGRRARASL